MDSPRSLGEPSYRRRRYGFHLSSNVLQTPVSGFLDLLGLFRTSSLASDHEAAIASVPLDRIRVSRAGPDRISVSSSGTVIDDDAELSIRIIGSDEITTTSSSSLSALIATPDDNASRSYNVSSTARNDFLGNQGQHRFDFHQITRWIEQVLPFSILLLTVFIRQHLQGFLVILWLTTVLIKANDILRKQTALKGDRNVLFITAVAIGLLSQITAFYWWHGYEDLLRPLVMLPPREIPKFWHAMFVIMANDMTVRQGAMVVKCGILVVYKNTRGRSYCRQGQLLTFVEYLLFLYRSLLPTAVWYRFFLNKDYGSFFSSLTTGLYLTFKIACVLKKMHRFISAFKSLSQREARYGAYATAEEVNAAGDICAICQEKMHAPILLSCKHIFCEDCVSEWFERERTCPLCRAIVKSAMLRSFGDGSTSLLCQIF